MLKKIRDITNDEAEAICIKARTKRNGKVKEFCVRNCPLNTSVLLLPLAFLKACDIIQILNTEIEVKENE